MNHLGKWVGNIVLVLLVVLSLVFVLLPAVFASRLAVVYSGSMEPLMPTGAVAVMQPVDPSNIKPGDIIAFIREQRSENVTISHRVIEVVKEPDLGFRTKGDANEDPDPDIVPAANVRAQVIFNVPRVGFVLAYTGRYTKGKLGFGLFVALPTLLLIGSAVRDLNLMTNPRMRRVRQRNKLLERRKKRRSH